MSALQYLTIPMRVYDANCTANAYIHGLPAMTAYDSFGHALERYLHESSEQQEKIYIEGVATAISNIEHSEGHKRYVCATQFDKPKTQGNINASTFDERTALIDQVLILKLVCEGESLDFLYKLKSEQSLAGILSSMRFAGGKISFRPESLEIHKDFSHVLENLPYDSWMLEDKTQLLDAEDRLEQLLSFIDIKRDRSDGQGYLIPIGIGYQAIDSQPVSRPDSRNGYPHIYAEPVIGLARARIVASVKSALQLDKAAIGETESPLVFWRRQLITNNQLIVQGENHQYA